MDFIPFVEYFPKIAERETRTLTLRNHEMIPDGNHAFVELYCADKKCDCRRTLIHVIQIDPDLDPIHTATISYGWESMDFYRKWSFGLSDEMLRNFKGPDLDAMQAQSPHAPFFLKVFSDMVKNDRPYVERLKRHYAFFKKLIGMKLPPEYRKMIDFFGPCPCGSGKKLKDCCGRSRKFLKRR